MSAASRSVPFYEGTFLPGNPELREFSRHLKPGTWVLLSIIFFSAVVFLPASSAKEGRQLGTSDTRAEAQTKSAQSQEGGGANQARGTTTEKRMRRSLLVGTLLSPITNNGTRGFGVDADLFLKTHTVCDADQPLQSQFTSQR